MPGPPRNVKISLLNSTSVVVSWDDPGENNGVIDIYIVRYFCADRNRCVDDKQSKTTEHNYTITDLYPYTNYTIVIVAHTVAGDGKDSTPLTITTLEAGEKS